MSTDMTITPAPITSDVLKMSVFDIAQLVDAHTIHAPDGKSFNFIGFARAIEAKTLASRATDAPAQGEWRYVPAEPTEAMIHAFYPDRILPAYVGAAEKANARFTENYRRMLAAAPAQGEQVQVPSGEMSDDEAWKLLSTTFGTIHRRGCDPHIEICTKAEAGEAAQVIRAAIAQRAGAADKPVAKVSPAELRDIQSGMMAVPIRCNNWRDDQTIPLYAAPVAATADAAPTGAVAVKPACRMLGGICACTSGGSFGGCARERGITHRSISRPTAAEVTPAPAAKASSVPDGGAA